MEEFKPCEKCNTDKVPPGFYLETITHFGAEYLVAIECECHKKWSKRHWAYKRFSMSGFNNDDFDKDFSSCIGLKNISKFEKYLNNICNPKTREFWLYFYGPAGTQKTTVASIIGKEILIAGFDAKKIAFQELVILLNQANLKEEKREELFSYENSDVLIIDDLKKGAEWGNYIETFLRKRITDQKGVIFCSQIDPRELSTKLDKNLSDLILRETNKNKALFHFDTNYQTAVAVNSMKTAKFFD